MSRIAPGVYIEEVSIGSKPIAGVSTSIAAFLGVAPLADAPVDKAIAINNPSEYSRRFVGDSATNTDLCTAVYGFFANGGSRCYVVNIGRDGTVAGDSRKRTGVHCLEAVDEVSIVAAPGFTDAISYDALVAHCESLGDRVAILDAPADVNDTDRLKTVSTGEVENADSEDATSGVRPKNSDGGFAAFYFPWIRTPDPFNPKRLISAPPSGHIAGVYARTDTERGVHKAPANEDIRGAIGLTYSVTNAEQAELNAAGVNCIRYFSDAGIRIWGARTLAAEASEWRYISVRRLFNMIEESILKGTRWVVFEPNDETTRNSVVRDVRAFLTLLWRDGALMGATPEQAFFVKCDAETNPPEVVDAGRLVTEIGIAPVKPAEFIVFRIGQWEGGSEVEDSGENEAAEGKGE
ncbi:phage tail sheath family protein [Thiolapillus sp.]